MGAAQSPTNGVGDLANCMQSSCLQVAVVTLFPELFETFLRTSFIGKARSEGQLTVHLEPLRDQGIGNHRSVRRYAVRRWCWYGHAGRLHRPSH